MSINPIDVTVSHLSYTKKLLSIANSEKILVKYEKETKVLESK